MLTDPYAAVAPYVTCESDALSVAQAMEAPVAVIAAEVIPEIVTGATRMRLADWEEPFRVAARVAI